MNYLKLKRIGSILLICIGAVLLISEIASSVKNYYLQSIGLVLLMIGVFFVNTNVKSKLKPNENQYFEEE